MLKHRVIPLLLLKGGGLYKTEQFSKPKYVGDPINAIRIFNEKEVDELAVLDIEASRLNKTPNFKLIEEFASECFMPLCYGGGVKTLEHASTIFSLGVEKVCIQSAAVEDTMIISQIANKFGSQSVVVSIDIKKNWLGKRKLYDSRKKSVLNNDILFYLKQIVNAGAGEIILNSVNHDGRMQGMDLQLIRDIANLLKIPVIAAGGVGSLEDIKNGVHAGADAIAVGSYFVFHGPHKAVLITYPDYYELEVLLNNE